MKILYLSQENEKKEKRFFELLYDERLTEGAFYISREQFGQVGGLNRKLKAKRQYELLLRLADAYFVEIGECSEGWEAPAGYVRIQEQEEALDWEGIRTDCYVISKYKDKLMQNSCFNEVVESVLEAAKSLNLQAQAVDFLEKMLKREEAYYHIDDAVRPILIYKGEDVCYNVLNVFAEQFGEALERAGQRVEYFDSEEESNEALTRYIGKRYQAIIGMQTYLFSIKMEDGVTYLHDLIHAPLYNFVFDHPIWVRVHLLQSPKKLCVFTLDGSYVKFCKKFFHRNAYLFPPAGSLLEKSGEQKRFAISFVGSCGNYFNEVILIHQMERNVRFIANRFLLKMRKQPHLTSEEAFRQALDERGVVYTDEEYIELFFQCRRVIYCVMHYYRVKVIKTILQAGLRVDVFGNSWMNCALAKYANLVCHADVSVEESFDVFRQSKLSLNVMSWHKEGFTERMANIMLCKSVLVTDDTSYLNGKLQHGEDLLVFRLDALDKLPDILMKYLEDSEKRDAMARNGFEKALKDHTWNNRSKEFIESILG